MICRLTLTFVFGLLLSTAIAHAQSGPGGPDAADTPIDARTKAAVVESLAVKMQRFYVFPEKANEVAKALRKRLATKEYDRITGSREFADSLLAHMQAVTHDLHTRVHYRAEPFPKQRDNGPPPAEEIARALEDERRRNYGFERVQRLAGNVGYLDLRSFSGFPEAVPTAIAAMNFLGNTDALIVDLRRNGGGDPAMIQMLLTWFIEPGDRLHINDFFERQDNRTVQFYTVPYVPGPRLFGKPLYVLIGPRTGSAAEEFAYDVQTHKLGTLIGATTAGAANPGGMFPLSDHLAAFIATGRAINPITKTNWEGTGVQADQPVAPNEALKEAHIAAIKKLQEAAKDEQVKAALGRAMEQAQKTALDPAEDFARPTRRKI